ncbi:MAG: FHA domain-containing protein [Deltaproteobacteria bacterium]|nr:FHA domain-containing protein [Deltaproteobacteria bacterium]
MSSTLVPDDEPSSERTSVDDSADTTQQRLAPHDKVARLVVTSGRDEGRTFALPEGDTGLGRGVDNDFVLTDLAVSRHHVRLRCVKGRVLVQDLGSGNGTLLNGSEVTGETPVRNGDILELGKTRVQVECEEGQEESEPPITSWAPGYPSGHPPVPDPLPVTAPAPKIDLGEGRRKALVRYSLSVIVLAFLIGGGMFLQSRQPPKGVVVTTEAITDPPRVREIPKEPMLVTSLPGSTPKASLDAGDAGTSDAGR